MKEEEKVNKADLANRVCTILKDRLKTTTFNMAVATGSFIFKQWSDPHLLVKVKDKNMPSKQPSSTLTLHKASVSITPFPWIGVVHVYRDVSLKIQTQIRGLMALPGKMAALLPVGL